MIPADVDQPASVPKGAHRYCIGCLYDLSSLGVVPQCPECGRPFDPEDPGTYLSAPVSRERSRLTKWGGRVVLLLLILAAFVYTLLPRPANLLDWRLWIWLGRPFGVLVHRAGGTEVVSRLWFGEESRREAREAATGTMIWRVERPSVGEYRVKACREGIHWQAVISAFNSMKGERFFGVEFTGRGPEMNQRAFEAHGDEAAILGALISEYGLMIRPFLLSDSQEYVWDYDPESKRMVTVDVTRENAGAYRVRRDREDRVLIPRPREPGR